MAQFVHLAPEKSLASILRNGIKAARSRPGVYAMPVTSNFYVSHQWLRELKRSGQRTFVAIYFRIMDEEQVSVGHYGKAHRSLTAAQAVGLIMHVDSPQGYEVVIPRKIKSNEIVKFRRLRQTIGWRYYPKAKGRKPCGCPVCQPRGEIKSRRLRELFEQKNRSTD